MGKRMDLAPEQVITGFGERLAALRKAAGFTQTELANELGISQRMVAYYEQPDVTPPARLLAIEKLGTSEKRQVLQLIDAYIERGQLRSKVQSRSA